MLTVVAVFFIAKNPLSLFLSNIQYIINQTANLSRQINLNMKSIVLVSSSLAVSSALEAVPRSVVIRGRSFVLSKTQEEVTLVGPNVVVKGPPYLPAVTGDEYCNDMVDDACQADGTCLSCFTFNQADIDHIKSMGWNAIRLGVVWAGAQPRDEDALDSDFLKRLHDILDLTDRNDVHVMLDNHGDMTSSAGCGNGVPMWFSQKAAPELIGKPLMTGLPYSLIKDLNVQNVDGYDVCGEDEEKWAAYAGDPNYNLLNECCLAMNSPNPGGLGYTTINQATMNYMIEEGPGRDDFVRFWRLLAEAVKGHRTAYAAELTNEPMSIRRRQMFDTWRAVGGAINAVIPDMGVSLEDCGEGAVIPAAVADVASDMFISDDTMQWIKTSGNLFYAWHWYGSPTDPEAAVSNALAIGDSWNVPTFLTEFGSCDIWRAAEPANISHTYWHYSSYCNTGPAFGDLSVPEETFGGCILGWAGGDSSKTC